MDEALKRAVFDIAQSIYDYTWNIEDFLEQGVQQCRKDGTTIEPETKVHIFISYHYLYPNSQ